MTYIFNMIIRNEGISMKISAKGRYGLAAMTYLARNYASGSPVTIVSISEKLGISKIYLEQVFSLLKRARLVNSIKGSQGGYQLSRAPREITPYDILSSIELSLMEETAPAAQEKMPELDRALAACVFTPLDEAIQKTLSSVSLDDILTAIDKGIVPGVYHFTNEGVCSWYDFTRAIHRIAGITGCKVSPIHTADYPVPAKRPHYSVLDKSKIKQTFGTNVPYWEDSLKKCVAALLKQQ